MSVQWHPTMSEQVITIIPSDWPLINTSVKTPQLTERAKVIYLSLPYGCVLLSFLAISYILKVHQGSSH